MRVLFTMSSARIGGSEKSLLLLLEALGTEIKPYVVLPFSGPLAAELHKRKIHTIILPYSKISPVYLYKLYRLLKNNQIKILHHFSSRIDALVGKMAGIKTVERLNIPRERAGFFFNKLRLLDRLTASWVDTIICASEYIRCQALSRGIPKQKLIVVYNGVSSREFFKMHLKKSTNEYRIGVFGRLDRIKGQRTAIEALPHIMKNIPNIELALVGDGPDLNILKELAQQLGIQDKVQFLGFKDDVNFLYNTVDVVLIPSLNDALPNVLLEARTIGIPVIATKVGGIPEVIKSDKEGVLVEPLNPKRMAKAIVGLLNNVEKRKLLSVPDKKFSLNQMGEQTLLAYNEVLKQ